VKIWIDAGGHRTLFAPGKDIDLLDAEFILENSLYKFLDTTNDLYIYQKGPLGIINWPIYEQGHGDINYDECFGAMIKWMAHGGGYQLNGNIANWRGTPCKDTYGDDTKNGNWADNNIKWNVEQFPYWIYIYNVQRGYSGDYDKVSYIGDNIYNGENSNLWPESQTPTNGNPQNTVLPWTIEPGSSQASKPDSHGYYHLISSTGLVWNWGAQLYSVIEKHPSAKTRFKDGSG
jgi:hypothetical protein